MYPPCTLKHFYFFTITNKRNWLNDLTFSKGKDRSFMMKGNNLNIYTNTLKHKTIIPFLSV